MNILVSLLLVFSLSYVGGNPSPENDVHFHIDLAPDSDDKMTPNVLKDGNDYAEDDIEDEEDSEDTTSEEEEDIGSREELDKSEDEHGTDYNSWSVRNELERGFDELGPKCGNRTWNLFNPLMPAILKRMETCKTGCYC